MPRSLNLPGRIARAEAHLSPAVPRIADRSPWDWYAPDCPCGRPAGECRKHPRARAAQRPPAGDWRTWLLLGGRAAGKTRSAAELVRYWAEFGEARRIGLVAPPREPDLWIHPRCKFLIERFQTYGRAESRAEVLDSPADPQHPAEEAMDALRGAVRTVFPEGRIDPAAGMRAYDLRFGRMQW